MSVSFNRTYRSPINNSLSKQLYSFSRAERFEPSRRSEYSLSNPDAKESSMISKEEHWRRGLPLSGMEQR